jgi:hypothetical protein
MMLDIDEVTYRTQVQLTVNRNPIPSAICLSRVNLSTRWIGYGFIGAAGRPSWRIALYARVEPDSPVQSERQLSRIAVIRPRRDKTGSISYKVPAKGSCRLPDFLFRHWMHFLNYLRGIVLIANALMEIDFRTMDQLDCPRPQVQYL